MANGQSSPLPSRGHAELLEGDSDFRIAFGFVAGAQQRRGGMKVGLRRCGRDLGSFCGEDRDRGSV